MAGGPEWLCVGEDGTVLKRRDPEQTGTGPDVTQTASIGSKVRLHYTVSYVDPLGGPDNKTILDSSRHRGVPLTFVLGAGEVFRGIEVAVQSMARGETGEFQLHGASAEPLSGQPADATGAGFVSLTVEDLDWQPAGAGDYDRLPWSCRLQAAGAEKRRGNDKVALGNYRDAVRHFGTVLDLLAARAGAEGENDEEEVVALSLAAHNNMSMCLLKLSKHPHAVTEADAALALQPDNVKALYRGATALVELGRLSEAEARLSKAM